MTCLRLALSHHRLLRTAMGQGASAEDDIFDALLSFVAAAKSQLSPWSIQTVRAFWECPFKAACRVSEVEVLAVEGSVKSVPARDELKLPLTVQRGSHRFGWKRSH